MVDARIASRNTAIHAVGLGLAAGLSYLLVGGVLSPVIGTSVADDELGGMWAVVAAIVVFRETTAGTRSTALMRLHATLLGIALCLVYVVVLPFSAAGLGLLVSVGVALASAFGRPQDATTTGVTIAVVLVAAHIAGEATWQIPLLRLADTAIGIVVGVAVARVAARWVVAEPAPGDGRAAYVSARERHPATD